MKALILMIMLATPIVTAAAAAPQWMEKPVQCAPTQEVLDRADEENMLPLLGMVGNTRIQDQVFSVPYTMFYDMDQKFWMIVEFLPKEKACVIGMGEGVNFNAAEDYYPKEGS